MITFIPIIIPAFVAMLIIFAVCGWTPIANTAAYPIRKVKGGVKYSWPSKQILKSYNSLPQANRPYANIEYILQSLDTKYVIESVDNHFHDYYDGMSWDCCGGRNYNSCPYMEYHKINNGIKNVLKAIETQKHELEVAGIADGLRAASDLLDGLKREESLIKQVTDELSA